MENYKTLPNKNIYASCGAIVFVTKFCNFVRKMGIYMPGPLIITAGAILECNKGGAPVPLKGIPQNRVLGQTGPVANIMDNKSGANIGPFGKCSVIKPPVCVPSFSAPWTQGCTSVMIGGFPVLTKDSKCNCTVGGEVKISFPGPPKSKIP